MMCADPFAYREVLETLADETIEWLHVDVMDGRYVPNFTLGPDLCRAFAREVEIPLDIHMMVEEPDRHARMFAEFPGCRVSFHPETVRQPVRLIQQLREWGASPGVALDPGIAVESLAHLLPLVDQVVIMTVNPGYAGQTLLSFCIDKIAECRRWLRERDLRADIQVDGNVSWENIPAMVRAGADILVAGTSSLFENGRIAPEAIRRMRKLAAEAGEG